LAEYYSREFAEEILASRSEYLFDDIPIINSEELKQMGLYEKFEKGLYNSTKERNNVTDSIAAQVIKSSIY
jgi:hypothetical protein